MSEQREITKQYLDVYIDAIRKGNPVVFVEGNNLLAVDHPEKGYLVLEIADKVQEDG